MGDGWKNFFIVVAIWGVLMIILFSNPQVKDFFGTLLSPITGTKKTNSFNDVIYLLDQRNVITSADFNADSKPDVYDIMQLPANSSIFYAGTSKGLFMSTNAGMTWNPIYLPKEIGENPAVYRVYGNPQRPFEVSILVSQNGKDIVYRSNDNFTSFGKVFELDNSTFDKLSNGRTMSITMPDAGGRIFIGTKK